MGEEVPDGGLPDEFGPDLHVEVVVGRVVQPESARFVELEEARGDDGLGYGREPVDRLRGRPLTALEVRASEALRPDHFVTLDHGD